ncbi:MAG: NUDIX domain-containing protein [Spirochaetales bacterium]|nr:NUDIX domain-containing protein [Spirochaetales bacterium]
MSAAGGLEIERKFLLHKLPARLRKEQGVSFRQGYVSCESAETEVRIRLAGKQSYLTMKKGRGMVRREEEIQIDRNDFESFWPFTAGARVTKKRYRIVENGTVIEIDEYGDELAGLFVAEVELPPGADFRGIRMPDWLGTEITGIPELTNQYLARHGFPADLIKTIFTSPDDKTRLITHAGAIPYKYANGDLQVLCITSRVRRRWIVPKGIWDAGSDLYEVATAEAWEEAGVIGILDKKAVGIYEEENGNRNNRIELFALKVERQEEVWPEMDMRGRQWFGYDEALAAVAYPGIASLMLKLRDRLSAG